MRCIDIIMWKPSRKHAKNRNPVQVVLGITNYDRCNKVYYLLAELDHKKVDLDKLISKYDICMIVETEKGYHFYFNICDKNPLKIIHQGIKMGFDKGHFKLALTRYRYTSDKRHAYLVLRVSPKYREPDLKVVYFNDKCSEWFREVKKIIEFF